MNAIINDIDKHECIMSDAISYRGQKIWLGLREKDMLMSVWIDDEWLSSISVMDTKGMVTLRLGDDHLLLNLEKKQIFLYHAHSLITHARGIIDAKY
jgi:hypothetical protein